MNRLKYGQKFVFIGCFILLLFGLSLYFLLNDFNKEIRFAEQERAGVQYVEHIRLLLEPLQEHRGMTYGYYSGAADFSHLIAEQSDKVGQAITAIDRLLADDGDRFGIGLEWEQFKAKWYRMQASIPYLTAGDMFRQHTERIGEALALIEYIRNASGLKFDSEAESYDLIEALIGRLPQTIETLARARGIGTGVAASGIKAGDWQQLNMLSSIIASEMDAWQAFAETGQLSAELSGHLLSRIEHLHTSASAFLSLSGMGMERTGDSSYSARLYEEGTEAVQAGYKLFDDGTALIDSMLLDRIDRLRRMQVTVTVVALFLLLIIFYLFVAFYISVVRTVYELKRLARRVMRGRLDTRAEIRTRDELAQVGVAFNKMIASFRNTLKERELDKQRIEHLAYHDYLTGLPNRTLGYDRLQVILNEARAKNRKFTVMFIDVDRFKNVNDTFGHEAGDRVLKAVADRLSACLHERNTIARMGGDEFLLVLPDITSEAEALRVTETIIAEMRQPLVVGGRDLNISVSIGISLYPRDGHDLQSLVHHADTAMYYAKNDGRNKYRLYDPGMNKKIDERMRLEASMHNALDRDEFVLEYQPRLDLMEGKMTGAEALIRWRHPERGMISPSEFIPLAEESGAINDIGRWVMRTVARQIKTWQQEGLPPFVISINISAVQFHDDEFVNHVRETIEEFAIDAGWLELELTERVVMSNADETIEKLKRLKELGVRISIDDFGTGFSSLSYLKYFPIDSLKIDRSFIKDIPVGEKDLAITKTIIALGRRLNLRVVAEGVETREQYQFLHARRCNEVQGYLISRPLPADEIGNFVFRLDVV